MDGARALKSDGPGWFSDVNIERWPGLLDGLELDCVAVALDDGI